MIFAFELPCGYIAESCRNRSRAVPCVKGITFTFFPFGESAHPAVFTQTVKTVPASCEQLVRIRLVAYIPYQFVFREIKGQMQCHRKFDDSQVRCQMPSCMADLLDQEPADLICKKLKLFPV